jgi:RNA polymerase sigma-70 factor (ECF subfamily)
MDAARRQEVEVEIGAHCRAGDYQRAAEVALEAYGSELLGFLVALHDHRDEAFEVFSQMCEDLWRGLPKFQQRASFRTWAYALARNALYQFRLTKRRRGRFDAPLSDCPALAEVAERLRTTTVWFLRTEIKDRLTALRRSLPLEDQTLLILRVDRRLGWNEIATAMNDAPLDDDSLRRESARLRQRFQSIKTKLRDLAERQGLIPSE